ncbi:hypothetical protein BT69DRAFT_1277136, partial [Atractiella rhizophila]
MTQAKGHKRGGAKPKNVKLRPATEDYKGKGKERLQESTSSEDEVLRGEDMTFETSLLRHEKPLEGCKVVFSGLKADGRQNKLEPLVKQLGGTVQKSLFLETTHLVCEATGSEKYKSAVQNGIPTVSPTWITEIYDRWIDGETIAESEVMELASKKRIPFFLGLSICTTGFSDPECSYLKSQISQQRGSYRASFDAGTTHLIIKDSSFPEGESGDFTYRTSEKVKRAVQINVRAQSQENQRLKSQKAVTTVQHSTERPFDGGIWILREAWVHECLKKHGRVGEEDYVAVDWTGELSEFEKERRRMRKEKEKKRKMEDSSELPPPPLPPTFNDNTQSTFVPHFQPQPSTSKLNPSSVAEDEPLRPAPAKKARTGSFDILSQFRALSQQPSTAATSPPAEDDSISFQIPQVSARPSMLATLARSRSEKIIFPVTSTAILSSDRLPAPPQTQDVSIIPKLEEEEELGDETHLFDPVFDGIKLMYKDLREEHVPVILRAIRKLGAELVTSEEEADYIVAPSWLSPPYPSWMDEENPKIVSTFWIESCFDNGRIRSKDEDERLRPMKVGFPFEAFKDSGMATSVAGYDEAMANYISRLCNHAGIPCYDKPTRNKFTHLIAPDDFPSSRVDKARHWGKEVLSYEAFLLLLNDEWTRLESKRSLAMKPLTGCVILVSKKNSSQRSTLQAVVESLGGSVQLTFSAEITHFVHSSNKPNENFADFKAARSGQKFIVHPKWVDECGEQKKRVDERLFPHTWQPGRSLSFTSQAPTPQNRNQSLTATSASTGTGISRSTSVPTIYARSTSSVPPPLKKEKSLPVTMDLSPVEPSGRTSSPAVITLKETLQIISEERSSSPSCPVDAYVVTSPPSRMLDRPVIKEPGGKSTPPAVLAGKFVNLLKESLEQGEEDVRLQPFRPVKPRGRSNRDSEASRNDSPFEAEHARDGPYDISQTFAETQDASLRMVFEDKIGQAEKQKILQKVTNSKKRALHASDVEEGEKRQQNGAEHPKRRKSGRAV